MATKDIPELADAPGALTTTNYFVVSQGTSIGYKETLDTLATFVQAGSYLLWRLTGADMTLTTDQQTTSVFHGVAFTSARLGSVLVIRRTGAFSGACAGGLYSGAGKTGNAWVAAGQSYAALTGAGKVVGATLAAIASTEIITSAPYLSLTTGNGAALTADVFVFGTILD